MCDAFNWCETEPAPPARAPATRQAPPARAPATRTASLLTEPPPEVLPPEPAPMETDPYVRSVASSSLPCDDLEGELAAILGGKIMVGGLVFVTGPSGSGKSTLSMELLCAYRRLFGSLLYWCDRDQGHDALVAQLVPRVGGDGAALRVIGTPPGADDGSFTWRDALERVPEDAPAFVFDSLSGWAGGRLEEQDVIMRHLRGDRRHTAIVIQRENAQGGVYGHAAQGFEVDAHVTVTPRQLVRVKSRWTDPSLPAELPRWARGRAPADAVLH